MVFFALIIVLFDRKPSSSDTFTLVTFMNLSGDQASMSSASHKELMGVLKQSWYVFKNERKKKNDRFKSQLENIFSCGMWKSRAYGGGRGEEKEGRDFIELAQVECPTRGWSFLSPASDHLEVLPSTWRSEDKSSTRSTSMLLRRGPSCS